MPTAELCPPHPVNPSLDKTPNIVLGVEGGKRVNYFGLTCKKKPQRNVLIACRCRLSQMVLSRIVATSIGWTVYL